MVASELRMFNWVNYPNYRNGIDKKWKVRTVYFEGDYIDLTDGRFQTRVDFKSIEPIKLSEDIVKKIARKLPASDEWKYIIRISAASLFIRFSNGIAYMEFNDTYLGDMIKTVHHLQNFCAVFGKELEIEL